MLDALGTRALLPRRTPNQRETLALLREHAPRVPLLRASRAQRVMAKSHRELSGVSSRWSPSSWKAACGRQRLVEVPPLLRVPLAELVELSGILHANCWSDLDPRVVTGAALARAARRTLALTALEASFLEELELPFATGQACETLGPGTASLVRLALRQPSPASALTDLTRVRATVATPAWETMVQLADEGFGGTPDELAGVARDLA